MKKINIEQKVRDSLLPPHTHLAACERREVEQILLPLKSKKKNLNLLNIICKIIVFVSNRPDICQKQIENWSVKKFKLKGCRI